MTDFGFMLSKSSTLDLDKAGDGLMDRICSIVPEARTCMACGSCSASCTAAPFSGMSLRKVLLAIDRGQDVRGVLSCCMLCGKCTMVCPRGINTRQLILTICRYYDR